MNTQDYTPEEIVAFWFPDGDAPTADEHMRLWNWRMRGGAHEEVVTRFSDLTKRAAAGDLDHWADMLWAADCKVAWRSTGRSHLPIASENRNRRCCDGRLNPQSMSSIGRPPA